MWKNNLKIAWRNLIRNRGYSIINIAGLTLGITATLLIGMWVYDEITINRDYENYETVARVMQNQSFSGEINTGSNQPLHLAEVLRNEYGNHFRHVVLSSFTNNVLLSYDEKKVARPGNFMEAGITEMLSLKMIKGTRAALEDPSSILISATTSEALFGTDDPMGKTLEIGTTMQATVAGVYRDLPKNSDFGGLSYIAPWKLLATTQNYEERLGWGNNWFQIFVQTRHNQNFESVSAAIKNAKYDNIEGEYRKTKPEIFLHPMSKWHLYSKFENGINTGGRIELVWLFGLIGIFILLLACINFMNLATARSVKRSKEVGIRKTIGSVRRQLIFQFFGESVLVVFLSFFISVGLALVLLPFFNELTDKTMVFPWANSYFWLIAIVFILITAAISGSYPAFYLSSFNPSMVLKGTFKTKKGAVTLRKTLVVFQFTISIALIVATITVYNQIQHAKERPVGYNVERLLYVPINTSNVVERFDALREELLSSSSIEEVAASDVRITGTFTTNGGFDWKGKDPGMSEEFRTLRATHGYGEMVDWEIKEGRNFSREFKSDSLAFILNETAVKYMGLENPVGETIKWGDDGFYKVIGVVKDMVTISPYDQVKPSLFILHYGRFLNLVNIKIADRGDMKSTLAHIEQVFKKYDPKSLFSYNFFTDDYQRNFVREERVGTLASIFTALAVLISCLGIFGLSAFMAEQRTKEIGVRKVLGASIYNLLGLLSKDFFGLVVIASCIAIPIGLFYMDNWLQKYEYRTIVEWWVPVLAIVVTLIITMVTISFQTIKASLTNPVKSLRTE